VASIPVLTAREVASLLVLYGFDDIEERGNHNRFRHSDGRATTVPDPVDGPIAPILLRRIANDVGMSVEAFVAGG
jgi:predicted RNA binding protein YcfA (HicA-like mRNA interferase family)